VSNRWDHNVFLLRSCRSAPFEVRSAYLCPTNYRGVRVQARSPGSIGVVDAVEGRSSAQRHFFVNALRVSTDAEC